MKYKIEIFLHTFFLLLCREFSFNDETYKIGDGVLISRQGTISQALGADDVYIARIMDLFEKGKLKFLLTHTALG